MLLLAIIFVLIALTGPTAEVFEPYLGKWLARIIVFIIFSVAVNPALIILDRVLHVACWC